MPPVKLDTCIVVQGEQVFATEPLVSYSTLNRHETEIENSLL